MDEQFHTISSNQYEDLRAEGHATQIAGNIGTVYLTQQADPSKTCLKSLWQTHPPLTDALSDRQNLVDKKGRRAHKTCEWIEKNEIYRSWLCADSGLLWVSGGPGKGKTMLSIFLAERLEKMAKRSQREIFIQYFCDNKDEKRNTAISIIRGLIFQLLEQREELIHHILLDFKVQQESLFTKSSFGQLWTCFQAMVCDPSLGVIRCVIDGLDECEKTSLEKLLKRFSALFSDNGNSSSSCRLNLVAVSREQPEFVVKELSEFPRISLDPRADSDEFDKVNSDITKFINERVDGLSRLKDYSSQLRSHVEEVFHERAEGTFLWVGIVAKELEKCSNIEVKSALENFPPGLDELYHLLLLQIPPERQRVTTNILRWVVMALRPLTIAELSTPIGNTEASAYMSCEDKTLEQVKDCGYLLTTTEIDDRIEVGLIHQSLRDYLLSDSCDPELEHFCINKDAANTEIAKQCLQHFEDAVSHKLPSPFTEYAVDGWAEHARCLSDPGLVIFNPSLPFYAESSPARELWFELFRQRNPSLRRRLSKSVLHIACYLGIAPLVENLLRTCLMVVENERDICIWTPLHHAACSQNETVVRLVISKGAKLEACDSDGKTALFYTTECEAVMRVLIEKEADFTVRDNSGKTVLHHAAMSRNDAVVPLLLERGADVNAADKNGETALFYTHGSAAAQLLIEKGADAAAVDDRGRTALFGVHDEVTARLLIENGADAAAVDDRGRTALFGVHDEVTARLLIENGADAAAVDDRGRTALFGAHDEATARLLIDRGVDVAAVDDQGQTALFGVFREEVEQPLMEKGADVRAVDLKGLKAQLSSALEGRNKVVLLLIEKGADVNAVDKEGQTALFIAAREGPNKMVHSLMAAGVNIHIADKKGQTALFRAVDGDEKEVVRLLIEAGADPRLKDLDGQTALSLAESFSERELAPLLIGGERK